MSSIEQREKRRKIAAPIIIVVAIILVAIVWGQLQKKAALAAAYETASYYYGLHLEELKTSTEQGVPLLSAKAKIPISRFVKVGDLRRMAEAPTREVNSWGEYVAVVKNREGLRVLIRLDIPPYQRPVGTLYISRIDNNRYKLDGWKEGGVNYSFKLLCSLVWQLFLI